MSTNPKREQVVVSCRHCQAKNRIYRWGLNDPPRHPKCGACGGQLWVGDEPLYGLAGEAYQHPWDREALAALHKIPGVDSLLRSLLSESFERMSRVYHFSSFLHSGPQQAPKVYEIFREAARRLDVDPIPDLFISHQEHLNAYTSGVREPFVAISAGLVEELREDELLVVFAHELGHWQSDHVLYKMAASMLSRMAGALVTTTFGLGSLAIIPLRLALLRWDRCSELTADRASLLAVRDPQAVIRTLMKLSGGSAHLEPQLSLDAFLAQVEDVKSMEKEHLLNRLYSLWQELFQTHPMPIWRTAECLRWAEEGEYLELLSGEYARRGAPTTTCEACGESYGSHLPECPACAARAEAQDDGSPEALLSQVRDLGQDVLQDVQGALQQGGQILKKLWGQRDDQDPKPKSKG